MKKGICLFVIGSFLFSGLSFAANYVDANQLVGDLYASMLLLTKSVEELTGSSSGIENFYKKMGKCAPAKMKYEDEVAVIYGKTKNGKCHYATTVNIEGEKKLVHCMYPMSVAIAQSSIALDIMDTEYTNRAPGLLEERKKQLGEILSISNDYCDYSTIRK